MQFFMSRRLRPLIYGGMTAVPFQKIRVSSKVRGSLIPTLKVLFATFTWGTIGTIISHLTPWSFRAVSSAVRSLFRRTVIILRDKVLASRKIERTTKTRCPTTIRGLGGAFGTRPRRTDDVSATSPATDTNVEREISRTKGTRDVART